MSCMTLTRYTLKMLSAVFKCKRCLSHSRFPLGFQIKKLNQAIKMSTSTSLEQYLREAFNVRQDKTIFPTSENSTAPSLCPDRINRVLICPGCYNPPHKGHLELVQNAFHSCGSDWNVIAAIIVSTCYQRCKSKIKSPNPMILTEQQRAQAWESMQPPFSFVYAGEMPAVEGKSASLTSLAAADGFTIRYIHVGNAEYI